MKVNLGHFEGTKSGIGQFEYAQVIDCCYFAPNYESNQSHYYVLNLLQKSGNHPQRSHTYCLNYVVFVYPSQRTCIISRNLDHTIQYHSGCFHKSAKIGPINAFSRSYGVQAQDKITTHKIGFFQETGLTWHVDGESILRLPSEGRRSI